METLRNRPKLAASNKEKCEEHPKSNLVQNTIVSRSQEDNITQISEEIDGRVTNKMFKEFSRMQSRLLGAIS